MNEVEQFDFEIQPNKEAGSFFGRVFIDREFKLVREIIDIIGSLLIPLLGLILKKRQEGNGKTTKKLGRGFFGMICWMVEDRKSNLRHKIKRKNRFA